MAVYFGRKKADEALRLREGEAEEARRIDAAETRREVERRWYATLPILAIAALTGSVAVLTGLLVLATNYVGSSSKGCETCQLVQDKAASAPGAQPSAPAQQASAVQMSFSSKELFGYNSTVLSVVSGNAQRELDACVAPKLRHVKVVGHADCIGSDAFNQDLSERRALAIKSYLTARGVEASRITTQGLGSTVARNEAAWLCKDGSRASAADKSRLETYRRVEVICEYEQPGARHM